MSFNLVFIRHEKPFYKDEGHDLTPEGVDKSIKLGSFLIETGVIDKSSKILLLHSPKPKAKGTLEFIKLGAELDLPMEEVSELRSSDFTNLNAFLSRKKDLKLFDIIKSMLKTKKIFRGLSFKFDALFFRNLILILATILIWRGVWNLADKFFFADSFITSNTLTIIIGLALLFIFDSEVEEAEMEIEKTHKHLLDDHI